MKKLAFLLLVFPAYVNAQSFSFAPQSMDFWGGATNITEISFSYNDISVHYFKAFVGKDVYNNPNQSTFAISYKPIKYKFAKLGGIVSNNTFPNKNGTNANFILELEYRIKQVGISYKHISNGFGLLHHSNLGMDNISLRYYF